MSIYERVCFSVNSNKSCWIQFCVKQSESWLYVKLACYEFEILDFCRRGQSSACHLPIVYVLVAKDRMHYANCV